MFNFKGVSQYLKQLLRSKYTCRLPFHHEKHFCQIFQGSSVRDCITDNALKRARRR